MSLFVFNSINSLNIIVVELVVYLNIYKNNVYLLIVKCEIKKNINDLITANKTTHIHFVPYHL